MTRSTGEMIVDIRVPDGLRALDPKHVDALAESMAAIGLLNPITVCPNESGEWMILIAGQHRLAAAVKLDWEDIEAVVIKGDEIERELWHIDENLLRVELTEQERGDCLERRRELFVSHEQAKAAAKKVAPAPKKKSKKSGRSNGTDSSTTSNKGGRPKGFAQDTADKTGMSKQAINRSIARATKIAEDVKEAIRGTPAANIVAELEALASMTHDDQREAVKRVEDCRSENIRDAKMFIDGVDPEEARIEKAVTRLYKALTKVDEATRAACFEKLWQADYIPQWMKITKKWRA